jgi:hypothetical protein
MACLRKLVARQASASHRIVAYGLACALAGGDTGSLFGARGRGDIPGGFWPVFDVPEMGMGVFA